jgi:hypothetical protein
MIAMRNSIDAWPVQLGIRLVLHSVSFTNPVPDWFDVLRINYTARETTIRRKILSYLGNSIPESPFAVDLPKRTGDLKRWSMPSVNDQIVFQTCVSSIAASLYERSVDRKRVYSYRYAMHSEVLSLAEDSLSSWRAFQDETRRQCASGDCILQLDLADAFRSIDRTRFIRFLRDLFPTKKEIDVIEILLNRFSFGDPGLPFVNDSIFFLGNAYLSTVDKIVARHSTNFIRFVDDYRIFGQSQAELDRVLRNLTTELEAFGFRINAHKLKLSSGEEYLESLSSVRYATKPTDGALPSDNVSKYEGAAVAFAGVIPPNIMVSQIVEALNNPDQNLNEGRGRLLMGSLRRTRLDAEATAGKSPGDPLQAHLVSQISQNRGLLEKVNQRLTEYATQQTESWRLMWLLYVTKNIDYENPALKKDASSLSASLKVNITNITKSSSLSPLVTLWASNKNTIVQLRDSDIEELHEYGYIASGRVFQEKVRHELG